VTSREASHYAGIIVAIENRYGHWSSSMRREMLIRIKEAETEIEANHYAAINNRNLFNNAGAD
jgi:hypothetical protein